MGGKEKRKFKRYLPNFFFKVFQKLGALNLDGLFDFCFPYFVLLVVFVGGAGGGVKKMCRIRLNSLTLP